jgi:hypothetical protein
MYIGTSSRSAAIEVNPPGSVCLSSPFVILAQLRGRRMRSRPLVTQKSERAAKLRRQLTEELCDDIWVLVVASLANQTSGMSRDLVAVPSM